MKPQTRAVYGLLKVKGGNGVTQQDAIRALSCYRLAARIADLRAEGIEVRSELVTRDGVRFSRYFLDEEPVQIAVGW